MKPRIAVLFDGGGLARLGLEQAGFDCVGFELNPYAHWLSTKVGSGKCVLQDARKVDLSSFDGVWASPPCQLHSVAKNRGEPVSKYSDDYLYWSLALPFDLLWVENVMTLDNDWGVVYNAAQFLATPIQNRNRVIGGKHPEPDVFRPYVKAYPGISPAVLATEYKGHANDQRRASRFYGRKLTLKECAHLQGFEIPDAWHINPYGYQYMKWEKELYQAIGNGVPCYMSRLFGQAALENM